MFEFQQDFLRYSRIKYGTAFQGVVVSEKALYPYTQNSV